MSSPGNTLTVRAGAIEDAAGIAEIYAYYVKNTAASFEYIAPSGEEMAERIASIIADFPLFVAERSGSIVGYAYASRHSVRDAYRWTANLSVYVSRHALATGVGRRLYATLLPELAGRGYRTLLAGIALPNAASVRLHEATGFTWVGTFPDVGYKLGSWRSVGWWSRRLPA